MTQGYRLKVEPVAGETTARIGSLTIAASRNARLMRETRLLNTVYFPRADVDLNLTPSGHRTFCPFKGTARYWHADLNGRRVENAVWSYENALPETRDVEGMIGFMPAMDAKIRFAGDPPTRTDDGDIQGPLVNWIMREAAFCSDGVELTKELAERFLAHGVAISRLTVLLWSLHPEIAGTRYLWRRDSGEVETTDAPHGVFDHPAFANSPLRHVSEGLGGVRQLLTVEEPEFSFPILEELKAEGATDYVVMPLFFSTGRPNVMTMASDHPRGFTTANLGLIFECSAAIARYYEVQTLKMNAVSLLDTYVGHRAGARVLSGQIRRGDGDDIEAAVLFCDLIGSTRLAEQLGREAYLSLLNSFFETVAAEVSARGGEVLKFIGDAVLAIFPDGGDFDARAAAVETARAIPGVLADSEMKAAIGLHFGPVTYDNVGAPDRLDFTVIGAAATIAARLSDLAKTEGVAALTTGDVSRGDASCGVFELHNIAEPVEVFALA